MAERTRIILITAAVTAAVVLLLFVIAWWIANGFPWETKGPARQTTR